MSHQLDFSLTSAQFSVNRQRQNNIVYLCVFLLRIIVQHVLHCLARHRVREWHVNFPDFTRNNCCCALLSISYYIATHFGLSVNVNLHFGWLTTRQCRWLECDFGMGSLSGFGLLRNVGNWKRENVFGVIQKANYYSTMRQWELNKGSIISWLRIQGENHKVMRFFGVV